MKVNWLYYVRAHSEFVACHHVLFLFRRGQHHYGNHAQLPVGFNFLQHLQPIDFTGSRAYDLVRSDACSILRGSFVLIGCLIVRSPIELLVATTAHTRGSR